MWFSVGVLQKYSQINCIKANIKTVEGRSHHVRFKTHLSIGISVNLVRMQLLLSGASEVVISDTLCKRITPHALTAKWGVLSRYNILSIFLIFVIAE